jgi:AcrR family transcriptional regulator
MPRCASRRRPRRTAPESSPRRSTSLPRAASRGRAIAARTHTTRALINYYFGSKEKLYLAVLERVYGEIREAEAKLDLDHLAPDDAVRRIVEFTYNYYIENQGFVRLVVAENQARGRHFRKSKAMRTLNRPIIDRLARVIERGQAQGCFRPEVDPVEIHKSIAALGMFNVTNQYTFGAIFQRDMGAKGDVGRRRTMVADLILSYLTRGGSS